MTERRYTDQEVARLLQRAADLDRDSGTGALAPGLSLSQLRGIAAEVGIDPGMVTRAATELSVSRPSRAGSLLLGESPVVRRTAAVPASLDRAALKRLIEVVDDELPAQGTVAEALGSVRWTSSSRFVNRQVVFQPGETETVVRVEERFVDRIRAVAHLLPLGYGVGGGLLVGTEVLSVGGLAAGAAAAAGGLLGWGLGRALWTALRGASRRRVERLAERLGDEASRLGPETSGP